MAASTTQLYFDVTNGGFVQSDTAPNAIPTPVFFAGDTRALLLKLVRRTSPDAVEVIDLTGVTVKVGFGKPANTPTVYTSATSSTVDANGFLPLTLDFTVSGVQTALGTEPSVDCTMEVQIIGASDPHRLSLSATIMQRLLT